MRKLRKVRVLSSGTKSALLIGTPIVLAGGGLGAFFIVQKSKSHNYEVTRNENGGYVNGQNGRMGYSQHSVDHNRNSFGTIIFNDLKNQDLYDIYQTIKIRDGKIYIDNKFKLAFFMAVSHCINLVGGKLYFSDLSISGDKYSMMFKYEIEATHELYERIYTIQIKDMLASYT